MNSSINSAGNKLPEEPHYAAATVEGWGVDMLGLEAVDSTNDIDHAGIFGLPITNFTIEGADIKKARVRNKRGKWLPFKNTFGMNSTEGLGDGTPITGIEIIGSGIIAAIHVKGGMWLSPVSISEKEGEVQLISGAGIDAIWIDKR